jgi:hypothetical protein
MSTFPDWVDGFLWGDDLTETKTFYNRVGYSTPCMSFFSMQVMRCIMFFLVFITWCLVAYINVKKCIIYIHIHALTYCLLALGFLFVSSGRQVIERKLKDRGEPVDEKERSTSWKTGVFFFGVMQPFVITANILFFILPLSKDIIQQTQDEYGLEWREPVIYMAHLVPLAVVIIELFISRLTMSYKHGYVVFILTCFYFLCTILG